MAKLDPLLLDGVSHLPQEEDFSAAAAARADGLLLVHFIAGLSDVGVFLRATTGLDHAAILHLCPAARAREGTATFGLCHSEQRAGDQTAEDDQKVRG